MITSEITSDINKNGYANDYGANSMLGILQSYCTNTFVITDQANVVYNNQYITLTTKSQRDPWGEKYRIFCNTKDGIVIVASAGPDNKFQESKYSGSDFVSPLDGDYKEKMKNGAIDDIILVILPKEWGDKLWSIKY